MPVTDRQRAAIQELKKREGVDPGVIAELERRVGGDETSTGEAVSRGIEEGASLGLAKSARGLAGAIFEATHPEPEEKGKSFRERFVPALLKETGKEENIVKKAEEEHPVAFGVSKGLASLVPAAPAFAGAIPALATGGAVGGLSSVAEQKDIKDVALNTGLGVAAAGAGVAASKALAPIGRALTKASQNAVLKAVKLAPTTMRRLKIRGDVLKKAREVADAMIKEGPAKNPSTLNSLYKKTASVLDDVGDDLSKAYKVADESLPNGAINPKTVRAVIEDSLASRARFEDPAVIQKIADDITSGIQTNFEGNMSAKDTWEFVKHLDKLSRQWSRASDPTFASKADNIAEAANAIRGELIGRINAVNPEMGKAIEASSKVYRNLSLAEGSLGDQVIREFSANRSIPRKTVFDAIGELLPMTPARLGAAKAARGIAGVVRGVGEAAPPTGIMLRGEK